ncbi:MAG: ParA family protein [Candidatus Omnitrophica bacterium]|nr:ParA family protein [Candidatus Omnitrophota bacterium]
MGKIVAICNQKGGTGKTTSAVNICSFLAVANKKILLVDIDPQGNATSGLGIDTTGLTISVYNAILEQVDIEGAILNTAVPNLALIPSHLDLTGAEVELVGVMGREFRLKKALDQIRHKFDLIVIDCPPSLGLLTINALTAADSIIIPIQCEYYALVGLSLLARTMNLVKDHLNPALEIEGVLLTMADYRTNLTNEVIEEARTYFKQKVYKTVIPRNIKLTEAPGFGKPIVLYDRKSIGAQKYLDLCKEIMGPQAIDEQIIEEILSSTKLQEQSTGISKLNLEKKIESPEQTAVE